MSDRVILSNRYQLLNRLGSGGMAMVYRAQDLMLERQVAIKILRRDFSNVPEFRERFRQEAKAAANLSHPNLVIVHDFGVDANQLFIVMEFVPGTDLKTLLKQQGRLDIEFSLTLMEQACAGIGYAHRAGLVHCDIKPQNILVTPDMRVKVVDFGVARALATISPDEKSEVVWGSPQYFSPEQASGGAPSPASDVYSIGVVMYEMLTGVLPFTASSAEELARLHQEELAPSPRIYNPDIPLPLEQIILKTLSKEPAARYRTAGQLEHILSALRTSLFNNQTASSEVIPSYSSSEITLHQSDQKGSSLSNLTDNSIYPSANQISNIKPLLHKPKGGLDISTDFDWVTWLLAVLALIAVGGLIPFWLWVYYRLNPLY